MKYRVAAGVLLIHDDRILLVRYGEGFLVAPVGCSYYSLDQVSSDTYP